MINFRILKRRSRTKSEPTGEVSEETSTEQVTVSDDGRIVSSGVTDSVINAQKELSLFDKIAAWAIIGVAFLLPLFFHSGLEGSVEFGKTVFLSASVFLIFLLWLFVRLKEGSFVIPKTPLLYGGILVLVVFIIAALVSPVTSISLSGFAYEIGTFMSFLLLFLFFFLTSVLFQDTRRVLYVYYALALSFVALFLFHLARIFFGVDFFSFGIFSGTTSSLIGKWNDIAVFAGFITVASLLYWEYGDLSEVRHRAVVLIIMAASLFLLAFVNFFLVWTLIGIVALVFFIYKLSLSKFGGLDNGTPSGISFLSIGILLLSVLFLVSGSSLGNAIAERFNVSHIEVRPSWSSTFSVVKQTWADDLFFGSGPGRFTSKWLAFKPANINETPFWDTDFNAGIGLIPTLAVTTGSIGTLAWILFLLLFLYSGVQALFASKNSTYSSSNSSRTAILVSFFGAFYFWIISIFYVPGVTLFALAFLFTGIFSALLVEQGIRKNFVLSMTNDPRVGFVTVLVVVLLLVASSLGVYKVSENYMSLAYFQEGKNALGRGDTKHAVSQLEKAIAANEVDNTYRLMVDVRIAQINEILNREGASIESIRQEFQDALGGAIDAGKAATEFDETNYLNWFSLGKVYASVVPLNIEGAYENAQTSFERAFEKNPQGPQIVFEQARLEASRGDNAKAREFIEKTLSMRSSYSDAIFLLAQLDINDGNRRGAITSLERASLIDPNNVGLLFRLGLLKYNEEDFIGAISSLERAVSLSPDYSNAKYFLGLSYNEVGRTEEAILQFVRIKELNPDNTEVILIIENLQNNKAPFTDLLPDGEGPEDRDSAPVNE